jgi:hypothetical protein
MNFDVPLNGWNVIFTIVLVLGFTLLVLTLIRSDLLRRIQQISSRAVTEIVADKELVEALTFRVEQTENQIAELRVRIHRLEELPAGRQRAKE